MPRHLQLSTLLAIGTLQVSVGCIQDFAVRDGMDQPSIADLDTATGSVPEAPTTPEPTYYSLDGIVEIEDGLAVRAASSIVMSVWYDGDGPACSDLTDIGLLDDADRATLDVELLTWWDVTVSLPAGATCSGLGAPTDFQLGIGPYDTRLDPTLVALELPTDTLYGLYLRHTPSHALYIFGVAGTSEQFSGVGAPVLQPPLDDGSYEFVALHLIPLQDPNTE